MTTFVLFVPSNTEAPQFQATLDGASYTVKMTWNVFGQRYYVTVSTLQGDAVFTLPMIGSPPGFDISLTAGYFASTLVWRPSTGYFEIAP